MFTSLIMFNNILCFCSANINDKSLIFIFRIWTVTDLYLSQLVHFNYLTDLLTMYLVSIQWVSET